MFISKKTKLKDIRVVLLLFILLILKIISIFFRNCIKVT